MDLRHLRYFQAVATLLNFSRAAEQLHVAQPAISRQIRDLEDEIGVTLFRRSSARVQLTEAGQYFLNQTDQLLELLNNAVAKARQIGKEATGQLNIGSDWNIPAPISVSVRKFRKLYPKFHVNFVELPSHEHMRAARSGQIHVGFVSSRDIDSRDDLDLVRVFSTEVIVVLGWPKRVDYRAFTRSPAGAAIRAHAKSRAPLPRVFHGADQQRAYATGLCERNPPLRRMVRLQRSSRARPGPAFPCRCFRARPAGRAIATLRQAAPGRDSHAIRPACDRACY